MSSPRFSSSQAEEFGPLFSGNGKFLKDQKQENESTRFDLHGSACQHQKNGQGMGGGWKQGGKRAGCYHNSGKDERIPNKGSDSPDWGTKQGWTWTELCNALSLQSLTKVARGEQRMHNCKQPCFTFHFKECSRPGNFPQGYHGWLDRLCTVRL